MVALLDDSAVAAEAAAGLKKTLLMFDQFHDVKEKADKGNAFAKSVLQSWADAEWFTSRPEVAKSITLTIFKVAGEINTDDLSPAPDAFSRPDIPMHALAMHKNARPGVVPEEDGKRGPVKFINDLKAKGNLVAYVGDVVGTGSAVNLPPTRCCGSLVKTFRSCQTSVLVACVWATKLPLFSTTPWKTQALCRLSWT